MWLYLIAVTLTFLMAVLIIGLCIWRGGRSKTTRNSWPSGAAEDKTERSRWARRRSPIRRWTPRMLSDEDHHAL